MGGPRGSRLGLTLGGPRAAQRSEQAGRGAAWFAGASQKRRVFGGRAVGHVWVGLLSAGIPRWLRGGDFGDSVRGILGIR